MSAAIDAPRLSRVARRRQRTIDEIVEVARAQLRAQEAVSISSVASAMGMTPPALYRYVPNLAGLNTLVNQSIASDLIERLRSAADRQSDAPAKLVAAATAFRQWALNNYAEYRSAFAPQGGPLAQPVKGEASPSDLASFAFADVIAEVVRELNPQLDDIVVSQAYRDACDRLAERNPFLVHNHPPELLWTFERAWVKFLGVVSYEAFGFLDPQMVVSGDMFVSIMLEIGQSIGLDQDVERLLAIAVETATWTDEMDGVQPLHIQYALKRG